MFQSTPTVGPRLPVHRLMAGAALLIVSFLSALGCGSFASQGINAEGVRLFDQSRYQESIRQFQQAVFSDPNNADAYYNLASAYHRLGTVENRPADLVQAERYYNQCLDHAPDHRECYRGLAVLLSQQGRMTEAFRLLEGWVDRGPGSAEPKVELARLCEETGDRNAAKQHLIDALKADERNARALAALGRIREQLGETQEAMLAYQRSLTYDRFQPDVRNRLAAIQASTSPQIWAQGQPTLTPPFSQQPTLAAQPTLAPQPTPAPQATASQPTFTAQATPGGASGTANPSPSAISLPAGQTASSVTTPAATTPTPATSSSGTQNAATDASTRR